MFLSLIQRHFLSLLLERKGERNIDAREKNGLVASCTHSDQELNPQPFSLGRCSKQVSHTGQGSKLDFVGLLFSVSSSGLQHSHFTIPELKSRSHFIAHKQERLLSVGHCARCFADSNESCPGPRELTVSESVQQTSNTSQGRWDRKEGDGDRGFLREDYTPTQGCRL